MDEYSILPENTYNMDEKGFMIGRTARSKRIFSRAMGEKASHGLSSRWKQGVDISPGLHLR
jgi:hypothetical protein